ncbi:serine hydrolase domain-containing protein [Streptosporangium sp. DT93]|uniref:serine hydrolase domain-containing protein n=1 Tax=Streptosporangium sp. DT93 TaxID=3393428 RepID=UPI003CF52C2A
MPEFDITGGRVVRRLAAALSAACVLTLTTAPPATSSSPSPPSPSPSPSPDSHSHSSSPSDDPPSSLSSAAVDRFVNAYREATGLPGVAVAVTRGSRVVHVAGYGRTASGAPVTERTPMAIASLSKSFTALAVVQLAEEGKIGLDAPVREALPEFTMADPRAARITVRQLLDQTSGMATSTFHERSLPQPRSLREAVARLRGARLAADPGTRWSYHNTNFQVAARLVEVVAGVPFADRLRTHVFGPLGMRDSVTIDTDRDLPASARGHLRLLGVPFSVPEPHGFGNGSGGVISSARDMARWMIMQAGEGAGPGGVRVVSAAGVARMRTPSRIKDSYALGWALGRTGTGAPVVEHDGDLSTATARQTLLLRSGHGIVVMANTGSAYDGAIAEALVAMAEGRAPGPPSPAFPFLLVDLVFALAAALTLVLAGRGLARSRRWAARRAGRPGWRTAARLLPYAAPGVLCLTITDVFRVLSRGGDATWTQVAWLVVASAACALLLLARVGRLVVPAGAGQAPRWRSTARTRRL